MDRWKKMMVAGEMMDREIARVVFGLLIVEVDNITYSEPDRTQSKESYPVAGRTKLLPYSTDLKAATLVFNEMLSKDPNVIAVFLESMGMTDPSAPVSTTAFDPFNVCLCALDAIKKSAPPAGSPTDGA